jgi:hypothetical protein
MMRDGGAWRTACSVRFEQPERRRMPEGARCIKARCLAQGGVSGASCVVHGAWCCWELEGARWTLCRPNLHRELD